MLTCLDKIFICSVNDDICSSASDNSDNAVDNAEYIFLFLRTGAGKLVIKSLSDSPIQRNSSLLGF